MLPQDVTVSEMERAGQEDRSASTSPLDPQPAGVTLRSRSWSHCWSHFHKPLLAILTGFLLFGSGTAVSLLYFAKVGDVPYLLGPLCLSLGLMFLVTGLVWLPVVKHSLEHLEITLINNTSKVIHGKQHQERHWDVLPK